MKFFITILSLLLCSSTIAQQVGPCQIFPSDNWWNTDISEYPIHPMSDTYLSHIGLTKKLHPDFGSPAEYGIPYVVVGASQPFVTINYDQDGYPDESDKGPFPIPSNAPVEGAGNSGDQHVLVVDTANCTLYELYLSTKDQAGSGWTCYCSAKFDLNSNKLRPDGWTSADAAGLPIFPGLVRYDEAAIKGEINHALRFTTKATQRGYITPARHFASSSNDTTLPPMGLRVRLKKEFDISGYTGTAKAVLVACKKYGLILADNGSDWFISGASDSRWDDDNVNTLKNVPATAFEAIYSGPTKHQPTDGVQNQLVASPTVTVSPNPIRTIAMIDYTCDHPSVVTIELMDVLGRSVQKIYRGSTSSLPISLDVTTIQNGLYFLRITSEFTTVTTIVHVSK